MGSDGGEQGGEGQTGAMESVLVFVLVLGPSVQRYFLCCFCYYYYFCLFIIQIATLLGRIHWVSSTSHTLGFPSWVLETSQLLKTIDRPRVTWVPRSAWQRASMDPSWGLGEAGWSQGVPGTASPKDQPLSPQDG